MGRPTAGIRILEEPEISNQWLVITLSRTLSRTLSFFLFMKFKVKDI